MGSGKKEVDRIRDALLKAQHQNARAVLNHSRMTPEDKAGSLILMATTAVSHAAFAMAELDPKLKAAPPEAQIADLLAMLNEVMTKPGSLSGSLRVIDGGKKDRQP